jgi:hypothetical protein
MMLLKKPAPRRRMLHAGDAPYEPGGTSMTTSPLLLTRSSESRLSMP